MLFIMRGGYNYDPSMKTVNLQSASYPSLLLELTRYIYFFTIENFVSNLTLKPLPSTTPTTKSNTRFIPNIAPGRKSNIGTSPSTAPTTKNNTYILPNTTPATKNYTLPLPYCTLLY